MPTAGQHGVLGLPPLLALARERGIDPDGLLHAVGIAPALLSDPLATVPVERVHALVKLLVARTGGDPCLGLEAGRHYHMSTFGLLGAVVAVTPTVREVVRLFVEYAHLTFTFFFLAFEEDAERGRLILAADGDLGALHRFYLDREMSFVLETARVFWPDTWRQVAGGIDLDYAEPAEAAHYRASFPCPVRFGTAQAAVTIDFRYDHPRGDPNPLGLSLLKEHLHSFASAGGAAGRDVADDVRREVTLSLARSRALPPVERVAATLGLSERVLRRRLDALGTSYRALADEILAPFAKRYLRDSALSLAEVADRLGYSEPASFVRAFRRWTGTTPDAWRSRSHDA